MQIACKSLAAATVFAALLGPPAPAAAQSSVPKPSKTVLGRHQSREFIEVKFVHDSRISQRDGRLTSARFGRLDALDGLLGGAGPVASLEPLFRADAVALAGRAPRLPATAHATPPDLSQWFRVRVKPGQDAARVIDELNAMSIVEIAYPAPLPPPPPATPAYHTFQLYQRPASLSGIDSEYARTVPGGDGTGVRVLDIEYSWNTQHEDLSKLRLPGAFVANGTLVDPFNDNHHGTAVMGQLIADENGFGVTGLVPRASAHYTNANSAERGYDLANAVLVAANALSAGDVMLIEQQIGGPSGCAEYVPSEWTPSVYDAIVAATNKGIHVVQAGGNGNMNLDNAACFGSPFPSGKGDSGSIIVGAGGAYSTLWCTDNTPARSRQWFSTYGARVDVQAWGWCVTTTGVGNLYNGGANATYTKTFNGTSSASPIVAAAVVALSGIAKQRGITVTPRQMRNLLKSTGTPQAGGGGNIGPLPNLRAAIAQLGAR
ncbi:Subtilase family protein [Lysobacter sp. yr284]|uniref:S8 family serine peptidase n=1 Tax=Lysobacter sp. yr284 TaxID=1761791 RepID=UPI00089B9D21|nr:S8 family serine peptidase [Lysobacter sp. yr284]SDY89801.1 Subtilase family protein [Lysobacter sp. yr284]